MFVATLLLALSLPAGDVGLSGLQQRMITSLRAGAPIVVEVQVALCDNAFVRCGGQGRGDGDDLRRNLYWATKGGLAGWMDRPRSGWTRVHAVTQPDRDVLTTVVWRRQQPPGPALRAQGIVRPFELFVIAHAWRGQAIDKALRRYVDDLWSRDKRPVRLPDGRVLEAGGAAHLVAYLGHNRWMDGHVAYRFPSTAADAPVKGAIALACHTAPFVGALLDGRSRVPLLLTRDFVFPAAYAFEGAVLATAEQGTLEAIRSGAAKAYAAGEGKPLARVDAVFTNPAHKRWSEAVGSLALERGAVE
jgi:hypothetical protein